MSSVEQRHMFTLQRTHLRSPRGCRHFPPPYQQQIISAYCIPGNGHFIPVLIACLSVFVFVLLCPCLSICPTDCNLAEQVSGFVRRVTSFISAGLPGIIGGWRGAVQWELKIQRMVLTQRYSERWGQGNGSAVFNPLIFLIFSSSVRSLLRHRE